MKEISQDEFEQYIILMINGQKTQRQVVEELQTESRTLNIRIRNLAETNPELYKKYIEKHSYKPKQRKDISALKLALEVFKESKVVNQISSSFGIGSRTFSRRMNSLKKSDNLFKREVYRLYKIIAVHNATGKPILPEEQEEIEKMRIVLDNIVSKENINNDELKRQELLQIAKQYNELCKTMTKKEAATKMGYTTNRIYKLLNELYRIDTEMKVKEKMKEENKKFRERISTDVEPIIPSSNAKKLPNKEKEIVD